MTMCFDFRPRLPVWGSGPLATSQFRNPLLAPPSPGVPPAKWNSTLERVVDSRTVKRFPSEDVLVGVWTKFLHLGTSRGIQRPLQVVYLEGGLAIRFCKRRNNIISMFLTNIQPVTRRSPSAVVVMFITKRPFLRPTRQSPATVSD